MDFEGIKKESIERLAESTGKSTEEIKEITSNPDLQQQRKDLGLPSLYTQIRAIPSMIRYSN